MKALIRRAERFLGWTVIGYLALGVAVGLSLFAVELAFAFALQAFLLAIGVLDAPAARLPAWLPQMGTIAVLAIITVIGSLRALLNAGQLYLQGASCEELRHRQRAGLLRWAIWSESASTSEMTILFGSRVEIAGLFVGNAQTLAIQLTSAVLLGVGLLVMAPLITLAAGAGFGLIALSLRFADRRAMGAGIGMSTEIEKTNARLVMSLKNLLLLQIYGTQGKEEAQAQESLARYRKHVLDSYWLLAVKYMVPQIFGVVVICLIALASTSSHGMSHGTLISYFYLMLRLLLMLSGLSQNFTNAVVAWPQTRELVRWSEAHPPEAGPPRQAWAQGAGGGLQAPIGWRLAGVGFRYPDGDFPVLAGLDLTLEPGRTVVVTGPSGAGKSTLLSLLLGLLKPTEGAVELVLDAGRTQPLEARRAELLRGVGYVGPESFLLEGTIRDNLLYGLTWTPEPSELDAALEKAECGFVKNLPRGLDHELTEQGQGLSAGQKQRLSLARALLRRPRVLILDEATSNLDTETESRLVETLTKLKGQITMVIVTHRASLVRLADQRLDLVQAGAAV